LKQCEIRDSQATPCEANVGGNEYGNMRITLAQDIELTLRLLGGQASLSEIYEYVRTIREFQGRTVAKSYKSSIHRAIQLRCADSAGFANRQDGIGFYCVESGVYGLAGYPEEE